MSAQAQVLSLPSRVAVDDLNFDRVTMKEAVRRIVRMAKRHDKARYVCTGNLEQLVIAERDPEFRAAYKKADLVIADGAPVVWLSKLAAGLTLSERVAGSDLFWELARASGAANLRIFFLGGVVGAAAKAAESVERRYPNARVCGTYCPPCEAFDTSDEHARIKRIVRQASPDILFVGFGAPKQEKWIAANKDALGVPISIGVGGSFEMAAGLLQRGPTWKQLFQRYFVDELPYLAGAAIRALSHRFRTATLPG